MIYVRGALVAYSRHTTPSPGRDARPGCASLPCRLRQGSRRAERRGPIWRHVRRRTCGHLPARREAAFVRCRAALSKLSLCARVGQRPVAQNQKPFSQLLAGTRSGPGRSPSIARVPNVARSARRRRSLIQLRQRLAKRPLADKAGVSIGGFRGPRIRRG